MFNDFFCEFLTFLKCEAYNFLISNLFLTIVNVLDVPKAKVQINIVWTLKTTEPSPCIQLALLKCSIINRSTLVQQHMIEH